MSVGVKTLKLRFMVLTAVTVRCRQGEQMVPELLVPTVKYGGGCVIMWGCFAGDSVGEFIKIGVQLTSMSTTASDMQRHAIPSGLLVSRTMLT